MCAERLRGLMTMITAAEREAQARAAEFRQVWLDTYAESEAPADIQRMAQYIMSKYREQWR